MGSNEEIIQLLQKTQTIFKQTQRDKEEKYLNDIIQLQDKIKDLENVVCKMGRSTDTLRLLTSEQKAFKDNLHKRCGHNGPLFFSQAYAKIPKLYRASELCDKNEQLHVFDSEETLEDAEKSQLKMNEFQKDEKTYKELFESVQRSKVETHQCDEAIVKDDFDEIEMRNIELEYRVASLIKENEHLKLTYKNLTAKFEAYFEKLEKTKVVLERQLARKVDDSKAEKDKFLKEINHLRTQLENLKGKSMQSKFDKHLILGKPPADKLLINSQISKSWFTPKVDVQKSLSKPVTTQSLPKNEKDQVLKRIAYLESQLASQDIRSCQKEYHELRTSYNALKVKFDSLNRQKWNINVSKSLKPKESVSKKVHTGESSKPLSRSQFTIYSLQKDRKFSKKSQSFGTFSPHKGFKTRASNENNQYFETSHSCFTPVKQVWSPIKESQTSEASSSQKSFKTGTFK
ncbi:hypothetical protein Tco_1074471 [Tanacetum coccineum]